MKTELTLKLDSKTVELAKSYAKERNMSLSKIVENYLNKLIASQNIERKVDPIVESLTGVITFEKEKDYKKAKMKRLIEKYK